MSVAGDVRLCSVHAGAASEVEAGRREARVVLDGGSDASTHTADSRTDAANNVVRCCFDPIRPPLCSALVTKTRFLTHLVVSADRRTVSVGDMVAAIVSMSRRRGLTADSLRLTAGGPRFAVYGSRSTPMADETPLAVGPAVFASVRREAEEADVGSLPTRGPAGNIHSGRDRLSAVVAAAPTRVPTGWECPHLRAGGAVDRQGADAGRARLQFDCRHERVGPRPKTAHRPDRSARCNSAVAGSVQIGAETTSAVSRTTARTKK
jgi:hypothetical protein